MSRPQPTPRVGWHGDEPGGWKRRFPRRARHPTTIRALRGDQPVTTRASVPRTAAVLSAAAFTSAAGAAATFALAARSANAAVKTRQPSSLVAEGAGGASAANNAVTPHVGTDAASFSGEDALLPLDADEHRRRAEAWLGKWENAFLLESASSDRVTLARSASERHRRGCVSGSRACARPCTSSRSRGDRKRGGDASHRKARRRMRAAPLRGRAQSSRHAFVRSALGAYALRHVDTKQDLADGSTSARRSSTVSATRAPPFTLLSTFTTTRDRVGPRSAFAVPSSPPSRPVVTPSTETMASLTRTPAS